MLPTAAVFRWSSTIGVATYTATRSPMCEYTLGLDLLCGWLTIITLWFGYWAGKIG